MLNRKKRNRVMGMALALLLALAAAVAVPVNVQAATGQWGDPTYVTEDGYTLSGYNAAAENYTTQKGPDGSEFRYTYDSNGKETGVSYKLADGSTGTYTYNGNIATGSWTDASGTRGTTKYNMITGEQLDGSITWPDGVTMVFAGIDENGNIMYRIRRSGSDAPAPLAVVNVTSDLSVFPKGSGRAVTFTFPRNVQSKFSELDSVRIPTMKNAETGEECWLGASQMTVEEKKITISESVISQLTPGTHKIEFIFSDHAHAIAEITVLDASNFDGAFYAKKYPDVQARIGNDDAALFNHYAAAGFAEKRAAQIKVKK